MSYSYSSSQEHRQNDNPFASPNGNSFFSNHQNINVDSPHPVMDRYHTSSSTATNGHNGHYQHNSNSYNGNEEAERQRQMQHLMATPEQQVFSPSFYAGATVATPRVEAPLTMRSTTSPHPLASAMKHQFHPTGSVSSTPVEGDMPPSRESLVNSARKEWKKHGSALTQGLEDMRRRDEERPGTMTARLMSAENRVDITNRIYTSYVLRVKLANNQVLELEHRYSEFVKLNDAFKHHGVELEAEFPPKHLAGRLGNWQVAKRFAPTRHEDLINYRKVQLDVWLVAVLAKYNLGDLPHSLARLVYEFMTLSDRPPCDMDNIMPLTESETPPTPYGSYSQSCFNNSAGVNYRKKNMLKWNNPISFTLGSSIRQACQIVEDFCMGSADQSIPLDLLQSAKGLIFLTVVKAGFMVSGRIGTGLLVARVDDDTDQSQQKWSAPCALGTIGMGWGMLAGGDITHYLVVLTTQNAVEAMLSGTVQLGTEIGVAMGPVGRMTQVSASASNTEWKVHPAYSYAHSKGLFMGMSIEGAVLSTRNDVNAKFYGRSGLTGADLVLDGQMPPPKAAEPLYVALERALATDIPEDRFRPSQLFQEPSRRTTSSVIRNPNGNGIRIDDDLFTPAERMPSAFVSSQAAPNTQPKLLPESLPQDLYRPPTASPG